MWIELRKIALVISLNLSGKLMSTKISGFNGAEAVAVLFRTCISMEAEMLMFCRLIVYFGVFYLVVIGGVFVFSQYQEET
jgi:hypothetical protein